MGFFVSTLGIVCLAKTLQNPTKSRKTCKWWDILLSTDSRSSKLYIVLYNLALDVEIRLPFNFVKSLSHKCKSVWTHITIILETDFSRWLTISANILRIFDHEKSTYLLITELKQNIKNKAISGIQRKIRIYSHEDFFPTKYFFQPFKCCIDW